MLLTDRKIFIPKKKSTEMNTNSTKKSLEHMPKLPDTLQDYQCELLIFEASFFIWKIRSLKEEMIGEKCIILS